jgi:3-oxoacyl-[acyl-carrier-protein] synthase II
MAARVVVTGLGVVSPLGDTPAALHEALVAGRSAAATPTLLSAEQAAGLAVAEVPSFDPARYLGDANFRPLDRTGQLAASAAALALADAGWTERAEGAELALVVGTMYGSVRTIAEFDRRGLEAGPLYVRPFDFANSVINAAAGQTAIWHHLRGVNSTLSAGPASGVQALALGADLIASGRAAVVLAGGAEELSFESLVSFARAGLLAPPGEPPRPFGPWRGGFVLGEGAAFLVLEEESAARRRGARVLAELLGHGTAFDPGLGREERGAARALRRAIEAALASAQVDPSEVDVVSAAASGSRVADAAEATALGAALGAGAERVAVAAPKGLLGEGLGAAGAIQAVALLVALARGETPGVPGLGEPENGFPLRAAGREVSRGELVTALLDGMGLDGPACALLLRRGADAATLRAAEG